MGFKNLIRLYSLFLLLIIFIVGCSSEGTAENDDQKQEDDGDVITISFAHDAPETNSIHDGIVNFTERVTELTDGKVEFEIFSAGQMGDAADYLSLTKNGVVDMSYHYPAYTPSEMPYLASISGLPGLYPSSKVGTKAYWEFVNDERVLESDFLSNGVRPVSPLAGNAFELFTGGSEIKSPEDLKGMQIRSSGGVISELMEHFGANPIQMPIGDVYTALDQGVIEAVNTAFDGVENGGIGDLVKFSTKGVAFGANMGVYSINEELFQSFSKDIQEAILTAGQEEALYAVEVLLEGDLAVIEQFTKDEDVTLYEPTEEIKSQWSAAYDEFIENKLSKEHLEMYELFQEKVKKHTD